MAGAVFQSSVKYRIEDLEREEIAPCARGTIHGWRPEYRTVESNTNTMAQAIVAAPC